MGRYVFTWLNFVGSVFADGALLLLVDSTAFNSQGKKIDNQATHAKGLYHKNYTYMYILIDWLIKCMK